MAHFPGAPPAPAAPAPSAPAVPAPTSSTSVPGPAPPGQAPTTEQQQPTKAAKAKAKGKAKATENPKATWDIKKAKLSTIDKLAFPLVDRQETKKLVEAAVLAKVSRLIFFIHMLSHLLELFCQSRKSCFILPTN